ncbi:MAG: sugar phosphate isomerase/epimerase [Pseudomonadota bacterium]
MKRRDFLNASAMLLPATLIACGGSPKTEAPAQASITGLGPERLEKFGLQLSTVTALMLQDFEGTLKRVAEIGYQQVEFSALGFLGRGVGEIQTLLKKYQLEAPVGRVSSRLPENFATLTREEQIAVYRERAKIEHFLDNVVFSLEAAVALEQKYLILPALRPDRFKTLDQVKANIELLNQATALCQKQGVMFGYHNHNWELTPIDDVVPYDLMLESTDSKAFTFQLDAYWIVKGGGELSDYLSRYPGRFSSCHMKDIDATGDFEDVGHGLIDFPKFTREALAAGAEYFFVERDNPPNPAEAIQRSYTYLKQMTF